MKARLFYSDGLSGAAFAAEMGLYNEDYGSDASNNEAEICSMIPSSF
jgi:hypothetical protein